MDVGVGREKMEKNLVGRGGDEVQPVAGDLRSVSTDRFSKDCCCVYRSLVTRISFL